MNHNTTSYTVVLVPALALLGAALAWSGDGRPATSCQTTALSKAPEAVRTAILHWTQADRVTSVRQVAHAGHPAYAIAYKHADGTGELALSPSGHLIASERPVAPAKLPAEVLASIRKRYPNAQVLEAEVETVAAYEVEIKTDGTVRELELAASGAIREDEVEDDDDEDEEDDDDDEDEEDDDDDDEQDDER